MLRVLMLLTLPMTALAAPSAPPDPPPVFVNHQPQGILPGGCRPPVLPPLFAEDLAWGPRLTVRARPVRVKQRLVKPRFERRAAPAARP